MKKVLIVLIILHMVGFFSSCISDLCDNYKYYDYKGVEVVVNNPFVVRNDSLYLQLHFKNVTYMASRRNSFSLYSKAFAIDCDKGFGGEKFPVIKISVTSNADFNSMFPAGSLLNNIITVMGIDANGNYIKGKLDQFEPSKANLGYFFISLRPQLSKTHLFRIEIEKSNGEIVSATSSQVTWE